AVRAPGGAVAHVSATIARSTVFGEVLVHALPLAENSIFTGTLLVARRQVGCVRFSYLAPGSRTPRRFHCQPDTAASQAETNRVRPELTSTRYGHPGYAQLALVTAAEIGRGAEDESEMGAFHDLYQPQRLDNLTARVDDHTVAGMDAGIIFVS